MITYTVNIDYGDKVQEGMTLPEALRELRKSKGRSIREMAESANMACSHAIKIEQGESTPGLDTLTKLLIALGVDTVEAKYGMYAEPGRVMVNVYV